MTKTSSDHHHHFQINFKNSYQPWTRENSMTVVSVRDSQPLKVVKSSQLLKLNRKYFLLSRLTCKAIAIFNSLRKACRIRKASHECRAFEQGLLPSEWKKTQGEKGLNVNKWQRRCCDCRDHRTSRESGNPRIIKHK